MHSVAVLFIQSHKKNVLIEHTYNVHNALTKDDIVHYKYKSNTRILQYCEFVCVLPIE